MNDLGDKPLYNHLTASLASHELFKNLEPDTFKDLLSELEIIHIAGGDFLLRQGDPGDSMYVVIQGRLSVEVINPDGSRSSLDEANPGDMLGEMALLTGQARAADVRALEDCELVRISRAGADHLVSRHPEVMAEITRVLVPRLQRTQLSGILKDLFMDLDSAALQDLQALLEWRHLVGGDTVYRQGEPGNAMIIIVNGRLNMIRVDPDGGEQSLGEFRRGSYLGAYVLLTGEAYRETVIAVRDTDVVLLSQAIFQDILARYPSAAMQISRRSARQQQLTLKSLSRQATQEISLALIPCSSSLPLTRFTQRLADSLADQGSILHLNSQRFDELYGKPLAAQTETDDPINTSIVAWLSDREANYNYVLYEADPEWTAWTRRCVRQADRIVLVAQADSDPRLGEIELALQDSTAQARQELVLLQPETVQRPAGTQSWLSPRRAYRHHHVRLGSDADFRRLARLLTGRATGLVLSGGAARGIAHLGVYRALLESGIEIDVVGGTSMGAMMAASIIVYESAAEIDRLSGTYFSEEMLHDRTLPITSIFATRKVTHILQQVFGDLQIEDLWRSFFCVSSNLSRSEPVVHRSGDLWKAVRASIAIPGVFSPFCMDGDILVDGGVMNNLPIDIMREECEGGTVIAVNASPAKESNRQWDFEPSISGWQVLWSRLNPFSKSPRVPTLFQTVVRATGLNSRYQMRSMLALADLLIEPDTSEFELMDWSAYKQISETGYQAGRARLAEWQKVSE